ncbi:uncharacterized protein H6S33_004993 [Morchella sextelata]|uniref:uncharacterized protein n=1 Tax=Morchella sextelata TaxID=1174677 RepID=UPI001D03CCE2|nr:uncharacterized protein H6S33_004993 [Morchella sextelata]KAH0605011.1 hypothetical protein H6S33_004993 [Morchella sextelata]
MIPNTGFGICTAADQQTHLSAPLCAIHNVAEDMVRCGPSAPTPDKHNVAEDIIRCGRGVPNQQHTKCSGRYSEDIDRRRYSEDIILCGRGPAEYTKCSRRYIRCDGGPLIHNVVEDIFGAGLALRNIHYVAEDIDRCGLGGGRTPS